MKDLLLKVEALIFASLQAIKTEEIASSIESVEEIKLSIEEIESCIDTLINKYQNDEYSFHLMKIGGGYKFLTKTAYHSIVIAHLKNESKSRLTKAAIETLSIIAYKQPVTRTEIESIRGVNCEYSLNKLLEKDLVEITGRNEGPGRPLIYNTTEKFMDYFGISSLNDLPKMKEIRVSDNQMGEQAPIEESLEEGTTNTEI